MKKNIQFMTVGFVNKFSADKLTKSTGDKIAVAEQKPKTSIKRKFLVFTVTLFLVILAGDRA